MTRIGVHTILVTFARQFMFELEETFESFQVQRLAWSKVHPVSPRGNYPRLTLPRKLRQRQKRQTEKVSMRGKLKNLRVPYSHTPSLF